MPQDKDVDYIFPVPTAFDAGVFMQGTGLTADQFQIADRTAEEEELIETETVLHVHKEGFALSPDDIKALFT